LAAADRAASRCSVAAKSYFAPLRAAAAVAARVGDAAGDGGGGAPTAVNGRLSSSADAAAAGRFAGLFGVTGAGEPAFCIASSRRCCLDVSCVGGAAWRALASAARAAVGASRFTSAVRGGAGKAPPGAPRESGVLGGAGRAGLAAAGPSHGGG